jgi:hypothetical protein
VKAKIYLEGGGDGKDLHVRCRAGFSKLLESAGFKGKMPQLTACGGRDLAYRGFKTEHTFGKADYVAMLVDSEDPVNDLERPWAHLKERDGWERPDGSNDEQVFLMATCMETWIAADSDTLWRHYGNCLRKSALLPIHNIEDRHRHDIQESLKQATSGCSNAYQKNKRSFEALGKLDPSVLEENLESFKRMKRILNEQLKPF